MTKRNIDIIPFLPKLLDGFKSHSKEIIDNLKIFFEALLADERTKKQTLLALIESLNKKNGKVIDCTLKLIKEEMKKGGIDAVRSIATTATRMVQSPEFVGQANANSPYFVGTIKGIARLMDEIEKRYGKTLAD
jgi:hypothetical protein